jgi:hypothetical protein
LLIVVGIVFVVLGAMLAYAKFLRLSSLPGDFTWSGRNWQVSVPLGTSLLISVILTIVLNLLFMRRR